MAQHHLPGGFKAGGVYCGIKTDPSKLDLALFVSDRPATAAGVFTKNQVCGAPVKVSRERVPTASARAVVINSGIANAATGQRGIEDAEWMTAQIAERIDCDPEAVLVCSTGVIGNFLSRDVLQSGLGSVVGAVTETPDGYLAGATGMMTTDTVPKQSVREVAVAGGTVRVSGACKGAAMIAPNMATMLGVVMTDAELTPDQADAFLREGVNKSFNSITVEGHTSTSDTVLLLANGAAGAGPLSDDDANKVADAILEVCLELAQAIIRDAEGAAHFVTIHANGFASETDARAICRMVAEDALVKTAVTGNDPNWGRIISACGRTSVKLTEENLSLRINGNLIYESGSPTDFDATVVSEAMAMGEVTFEIESDLGSESACFWTSDLTQEYVRLNSEYTT
jgi:glutamate N-acetyltransferase/amino-acid N-acetyltransferase